MNEQNGGPNDEHTNALGSHEHGASYQGGGETTQEGVQGSQNAGAPSMPIDDGFHSTEELGFSNRERPSFNPHMHFEHPHLTEDGVTGSTSNAEVPGTRVLGFKDVAERHNEENLDTVNVGVPRKKGADKRWKGEVRTFEGKLVQREGPGHEWGKFLHD